MESGNGGDSSKGVLEPVLEASDAFLNVLTPLKRAYLYQESSLSFEYKSAFLVKNSALEEKYVAFRAKQRAAGYSEEDLEETYGFLLFEDFNKANSLGETGVVTGNSTCTTLGDPSKGVYISMYSDCLDLNRWYHGKSGYIAVLKLTKGRVKKVLENYTETFTAPTAGFDCHVSEQLPSVSDKTSSFLAFERTQYYIYELLKAGSSETLQSPSAACPYAIVSFSYTDTKVAPVAPQQKREEKKLVSHYVLWRGQLQIGDLFYNVSLRSSLGALIPAILPSVVKVERVISMLDLRRVVPPAVFETSSREVLLDGLCCSLCEFVSSDEDEASSLSQLLCEVKEKNVALTISLSDGGFLVLVHSSHFLTFDDSGSAEVFRAVFVFPDSRVIQRDTKCGHRKPAISADILRVLPVLNYAEGEVEKTLIDPSEDPSEVLAQHMQSYAALINPGLGSSPSREVSIFADQYDVPDDHKHLYTSSEWTPRAWQSLQSYLSRPASFQLPVAKALEILEAGQENRIEDLNDDVYICLSSPEEAPVNTDDCLSEDQSKNNDALVDSSMTEAETPMDLSRPHTDASDDLQVEGSDEITDKSEPSVLIKTDFTRTNNLLIPSTSDELPAELIVSITSAERTNQGVMSTELPKKPDFSTAKSQTDGIITPNDAAAGTKKPLDTPMLKDSTKTKRRKGQRSHYTSRKKVCNASPAMQTPPVEHTNLTSHETDLPKELEENQQSGTPPITVGGKTQKQKRLFGKLSPSSKTVTSSAVGPAVTEETRTNTKQQTLGRTILMEFESFPLRKKTERWDLKPVLSECGSVLVPHGSLDIAGIKSLQDKLQLTKTDQKDEKPLAITSEVPNDTPEMEQTSATAPETTPVQDRGNHLSSVTVSPVSPKPSILSPDSDPSCESLKSNELPLRTEVTGTVLSEDVQDNPSDTLPTAKSSTKGHYFLSKLKSVLLRGKRKMGLLESEEMTEGITQAAEPSIKVSKVDTDTDVLKDGDTNVGIRDVSEILSVDHHFAYALGLTPRQIPRRVQRTDDLCTQQREDSLQVHEQTKYDKHKILQRPPLMFPRRGRIKTLKKHQDVSAENIKKKSVADSEGLSENSAQSSYADRYVKIRSSFQNKTPFIPRTNGWLHFQSPACYEREMLINNEFTRDNSVRKTIKEKLNRSCSSTDALTLLADLALSANHDKVPPQQALERQPDTSLKECDLSKDLPSVDKETVLHALLRQPAGRPIQTLDSPAPAHHVGGKEFVDLVSKEHDYSLPPSSSLPLGLPGTPQVSSVSGSAGQLHHQKTMCDDGSRTQYSSVDQTDITEQVCWTPDIPKKLSTRRRKFRHSRTIVNKDGSIQVTKKWKGNYDFSLDSKFSNDSKDKTIVRALHGPWDNSHQDISEEMRLIVHMWIGLFYSRSTARFFHLDPDLAYPHLEESDPLEMSAIVSGSKCQKEKVSSDALCQSGADTLELSASKALDLSKKDNSALEKEMAVDQGSLVLDLSLKNTNAEVSSTDLQVNKEDTGVSYAKQKEARKRMTAKSHKRQKEASSSKVNRETVPCTKTMIQGNGIRSIHENNRTCIPLPTPCLLGPNNVLLVPIFPLHSMIERASIDSENSQNPPGFFDMLQGHNSEKTDVKDSTGNPVPVEMGLLDSCRRASLKSMMDPTNKEAGSVVPAVELNASESKDEERLELKEKLHQEDSIVPSQKLIQSDCKNSGIAHSGYQLLSMGPVALSQCKTLNVHEDVPCTFNENKLPKGPSGTEDRLVEKDISAIDESSHLISMMCNGPSSGKDFLLDDQPPQADNKEESLHDLQSTKQCAINRDNHAKSEKDPNSLTRMESMESHGPAVKEETKAACLPKKAIKTESTCSSDMSIADIRVPQTSDREETRCKDKLKVPSSLKSENHKDQDTIPVEKEEIVDIPVPQISDGVETRCKNKQMIPLSLKSDYQKDQDTIPVQQDEIINIPVPQTSDGEETRCKDKQIMPSCQKSDNKNDQDTIPVEKEEMVDIPVPQTSDGVETRCKDKQMIPLSLKSDNQKDQDTIPVEQEEMVNIPFLQTSDGAETRCKDDQKIPSGLTSDDHTDQDTIPVESEKMVDIPAPQISDGKETRCKEKQMIPLSLKRDNQKDQDIIPFEQEEMVNIPFLQTSDRAETRCKDDQKIPSGLKSDDHTDQDTIPVESEKVVDIPAPQISDGKETRCKEKQMIPSSPRSDDYKDQDLLPVEKKQVVDVPAPETSDGEETRWKDKQLIPSSPRSDDHKDQDLLPVEREQIVDILVPQTPDGVETWCKDKQMIPSSPKSDNHKDQDTLPVEREQIVDLPVAQTSDGVETWCKDKQMIPSSPKSDDHKDQDTIPVEREQIVDNTGQEEPSLHQSLSSQFEQSKTQAEMAPNEPDFETTEGLKEHSGRVIIPFLGEDLPSESTDLFDVSESQGQNERASTSETTNPEVCSTSSVNIKKTEKSSGTVSFLKISETNQLLASGRGSDDRCPTPTMDEKPYETPSCLGPSSVTPTIKTEKCLNRSSLTAKNFEQKPCQKSVVNGSPYSLNVLQPDVELRTLRVFQSIGKFLSKSTENSSQIETTDMKQPPHQTPNTKSKNSLTCPPQSHHAKNSKVQKASKKKLVPVPQEQHTGPSGNSKISLFKGRIEEVLGVRLQSEKTELLNHQQYYERTETSQASSLSHTLQFVPSSECLGPTKANVDQDRPRAMPQTYSSHEQRSSSQRPVMAVKPSKSDESQGDCLLRERLMGNSYPKNQQTKESSMMLLEKKMGCFKGNSEGLKKELSSRRSWLPHESDRKPESYKASFARRNPVQYEPKESSKYCKGSSSTLSGKHGFLGGTSAEKVSPTAEGSLEMHPKDCLDRSASHGMNEDLYLGPDCSLSCTVYNTDRMRSHSFLEQMSNRCIQDDPTMASMENECLIFSEKMKQLIKRCKTEYTHQPNPQDELNQSGSSPLTIHFASLEGLEEPVKNLDMPSLLGQKIKVDTSDREELAAATEKSSQQTGASIEHAGVSRMTAECAELYEETMNDVCAVRNVPSKLSHLRLDRGYSKSEPSNYFDFCDQMKKEMDESFRSNLNSIVKKSCKTKYRFYILETSDDTFFEETKAHLEAEGHTAIQPSEFFLDKSSSSSLLIIIRNEDIAENVCQVPHLLELKKSPDVHFAGIDEPDDVVNLTHQELFSKGGFIMIDRAVLEPLSLCDMKKMSEILQELSRTGKWKWMLHYRDSRRIKENARLSPEAKEKKNFLNGCQESGIVDVLPYHECDLMSKDQPDYLTCLVRLQVQNILARYTVFITDSTTDSRFESNGIITMTFDSFLSCSLTEVFTI